MKEQKSTGTGRYRLTLCYCSAYGFTVTRKGESFPLAGIRNLNGRNSPSWGDCYLSVDLTSDGISATGGRPRFVPLTVFPLAPYAPRCSAVRKRGFRAAIQRIATPSASLRSALRAPGRKNRKEEKFHLVVYAPALNFLVGAFRPGLR